MISIAKQKKIVFDSVVRRKSNVLEWNKTVFIACACASLEYRRNVEKILLWNIVMTFCFSSFWILISVSCFPNISCYGIAFYFLRHVHCSLILHYVICVIILFFACLTILSNANVSVEKETTFLKCMFYMRNLAISWAKRTKN